MNTKHTPTPWRVSKTYQGAQGEYETTIQDMDGIRIITVEAWKGDAQEEAESNADFLVLAVNTHDELVAALELAKHYLDISHGLNRTSIAYAQICAALPKAKGE